MGTPASLPRAAPRAPYARSVEILLWLVPPVVVTGLAMVWVGWAERERPAPDRDEQVRRIEVALRKEPPAGYAVDDVRPRDRSTGVAVRRRRAG